MRKIPQSLARAPFTSAMARREGVTARQLQAARFRRLFHGVYVDARLTVTQQVLAQAVSLVLPAGAVVAGTTAALLHGADVRRCGYDSVEVVVPRDDQVRRVGVRARAALLEAGDVTTVRGIACLSPVRVAFDLARQRRLVDAVVGVDAMCNRGGCALPELEAYVAGRSGWRGVRYAREALLYAEPLSESVMETKQRMALVQAGLPRPRAQVDLFDDDGFRVARLDHGYERWKVGLDYDGEVHRERWRYDLERQERIRDLGWWHRRYTSIHAAADWRQLIRQVGEALVAAGWRP
ncbi:MAG TPA: type IV toxin-antitoxin system AbiEi family antitoxin [Mycobacteriales bacterium]|nr:type IV toxin-antitoxin system AbiEi family antitoxin [Mycobacteriales bacterium]